MRAAAPRRKRRHRWRARPLDPLEAEQEEEQPSTSGTSALVQQQPSSASVEEVRGGEEEALPLPASPEPAEEGEPQSHAAGSLLPPIPLQGVAEEEPWHPVVHYAPPPSDMESWEVVGEPEPAGWDHQRCQENIQQLCGELERARMLFHLQGQQL